MGPLSPIMFSKLHTIHIFSFRKSDFVKWKNCDCLWISSLSDTIILFCVNLIYTQEKKQQF